MKTTLTDTAAFDKKCSKRNVLEFFLTSKEFHLIVEFQK